MAKIYRHKESGNLYLIEHLVKDIRFLNGGGFEGIYAYPFKWAGPPIKYARQDVDYFLGQRFTPTQFVEDNFEIVAELRTR